MNKKIFVLLPALVLMLGACGPTKTSSTSQNSSESSEQVAVEGVNINKTAVTLDPGETVQLTAIATPSTLSDKTVSWSTDNETVATVSSGGLVTANAHGTAKIKATANADSTKFAECTITVNAETIVVAAETPDLNQTYKLGTNQKNVSADTWYYFKGSVNSDTRGEVADNWSGGVDMKFEAVTGQEGKYYTSFELDGAKKYFEMDDDHHYAVVASPTAGREWDWNAELKTVTRTIGTTTYFPGTYNNYDTVSGCNIAQVASDFIFQFLYKVPVCEPETVTVVASKDVVYAGGTLQLEAELGPIGARGDVTWSVDGDDKVTIDQTGLLSAAADATLNGTVTVTAAYSETVKGTKVITVKEALNYGTQAAPLTIAQAKALLDKENPSAETMYVEGVVSANDAWSTIYNNWGAIWMTNDDGTVEKEFEAYRAVPATGTDFSTTYADKDSLLGKKVVFSGIGKIFGSTYELDSGCNLLSVADGGRVVSSIAVTPNEDAEVEQGATLQLSAAVLPYGAAYSLSWQVAKVGEAVEGKVTVDATGKVTVAADATVGDVYNVSAKVGEVVSNLVKVTVKEASGGGAQTVVADFTTKAASNSSYSNSWTYGDYTIVGGANNNGGWAFVKMGGKASVISAEGYLGTYIATKNAINFGVSKVTLDLVGKCYNQDTEKAVVTVEAYSDAALTTKVATSSSGEVPAITTNEGTDTLELTFASAPAANLYYKVDFAITNTTTYNGVVALAKVTFSA